jgi:murein DD-endopeptidase MepM/ murein hydrolase activator NlpD
VIDGYTTRTWTALGLFLISLCVLPPAEAADAAATLKGRRKSPGQRLASRRRARGRKRPARRKPRKHIAPDHPWIRRRPLAKPYMVTDRWGSPRSYGGHTGTDLGHPGGGHIIDGKAEVFPVGRGRVTHAGLMGGYGYTVVVRHGSRYSTQYSHLAQLKVRVGQKVDPLHSIGKVGGTGAGGARSYTPHLHFMIFDRGTAQNPERYMKF